ncbi:MAG: outer membrane protein assembly factor BamA [Desulfuromonadales bacterium]
MISKISLTVFVLFCLLLSSGSALAETYDIVDVQVEGHKRVDPGAIKDAIAISAGSEASLEEIDRDVRELFSLGRFEDVSAVTEQKDEGTVLIYRIVERPLVRRIKFEGNDEFKYSKLSPIVTFSAPHIYNPLEIRRSKAAIEDAYAEEGFYAAEVEADVDFNERDEATVTFVIDEGEKVLIDEIRFAGNTVFTDKELKKAIETRERWFLSWLTDRGTYREDMLQNDLEIIADQYFNKGYVRVDVRQPVTTLSEDKTTMDLLIEIDEGEQFHIGSVDLSGDLLKDKDELLELVSLEKGDVFSRKVLRESIFALNDFYADRGYAYVNVSPLTRLDTEENLVNLTIEIEQGSQVHVDRIEVSGNTKTRDKVIRREMRLVEGDLFSSSKLKRSRQRINNLGFFDEVKLNTDPADEDGMEIDIEVKERPTGTFTLGFGYSSVDKLVGQGSIQQDNFLGRALKLNLAGSFGSSSTTYNLGLQDPYFLDTEWTLGGDLYNTDREWNDFSKETRGGDIKLGYPVTENSQVFFIYKYEDKDIYDVDPSASDFVKDQEGTSTLSSVFASWTRDTTDYRLEPTTGSVTRLSTEVAGLGGTEKFAKVNADYRRFYPFKWDTVFSVHGQMGYIHEIGGEEIPIDERFYLGGLSTIRGFKTREVGPRIRSVETFIDPQTGETSEVESFEYIGGVKKAFFNLEYTFPVIKDAGLKGVLFFDVGNAWADDENYFSDMRYSTGWGIRWVSPMGPLRLEWGYNLDPREGEKSSEFEFSIGRFF